MHVRTLVAVSALAVLAACSGSTPPPAPSAQSYGANPPLPAPRESGGLLPTIRVASVAGWGASEAPTAPAGFVVTRYADGMDHPRWMHVLANGDVLVSQATTPRAGGLRGFIAGLIMGRAGATGESPNNIILLRDSDGDGDVDARHTFLSGLNQPFGMAVVGNALFVANTNEVLRFDYAPGATSVSGPGQRIAELPYNEGNNGHWTRDLLVSRDGTKLYVTVGSVSNVPTDAEQSALERNRATVLEMNLDGSGLRVFASGLRNPNGLAWEPTSGALWVNVNERDELGDDLVPDYMTSVQDGAFYGWPYSYYGQNVDTRVQPQNEELVERAIVPDFALGAHTASLGLAFYTASAFPERYRGGAFIGQHGSWNRSEFAGYKVVFVPFANGRPSGDAEDFLTGFLNGDGEARGRPVGVALDRTGALLVADDAGNTIWRVAPAMPAAAPAMAPPT